MKNQGDLFSGVPSAVFPATGQPCPNTLPLSSPPLHHAVTGVTPFLCLPLHYHALPAFSPPVISHVLNHNVFVCAPPPNPHRVYHSVHGGASPLCVRSAHDVVAVLSSARPGPSHYRAEPVFTTSTRLQANYDALQSINQARVQDGSLKNRNSKVNHMWQSPILCRGPRNSKVAHARNREQLRKESEQ
jgi:hypothetical protein